MHTHRHTHTHTHTHTLTCTRTDTHTLTRRHSHTQTYTDTRKQTHTYVHTQTQSRWNKKGWDDHFGMLATSHQKTISLVPANAKSTFRKIQIPGSNFTRACAAAEHFASPFGGSDCGRKVLRDCTGSSEVASGNLSFFRKVDFALAGTVKIDFWGEFASTRKTAISFRDLRSGTKNEALRGGGGQNRFS